MEMSSKKECITGTITGKRRRGRPGMQYVEGVKKLSGRNLSRNIRSIEDRAGWKDDNYVFCSGGCTMPCRMMLAKLAWLHPTNIIPSIMALALILHGIKYKPPHSDLNVVRMLNGVTEITQPSIRDSRVVFPDRKKINLLSMVFI